MYTWPFFVFWFLGASSNSLRPYRPYTPLIHSIEPALSSIDRARSLSMIYFARRQLKSTDASSLFHVGIFLPLPAVPLVPALRSHQG